MEGELHLIKKRRGSCFENECWLLGMTDNIIHDGMHTFKEGARSARPANVVLQPRYLAKQTSYRVRVYEGLTLCFTAVRCPATRVRVF